uniref:Uncharacterized protein n=1 Tax=Rhizophora mucronata TaxID=61149 RepID=A0A2P2NLE5_RHIMU
MCVKLIVCLCESVHFLFLLLKTCNFYLIFASIILEKCYMGSP